MSMRADTRRFTMAESSKRRKTSPVAGSGKEYNGAANLTAKMTPQMKKRLAKKSKGK